MKKLLCCLFFTLSICYGFDSKSFEKYVIEHAKQLNIPGLAIGIIDHKNPYKITFGLRCIKNPNEKIDSQTVFQIASLTKAFTSTLIAILVDKGLLNFDDRIIQHIPDFKMYDENTTQNMTIRDVLGHKTGFKHFSGDSLFKLNYSKKDIFKALSQIPTIKQLGKDYSYQNHFYGLMEQIIEKVTKKTLNQAAKEYLFEPLGLTSTNYVHPKSYFSFLTGCSRKKNNVAKSHQDNNGIKCFENSKQFDLFPTSLGISSNLDDMIKWLQFNMYGNEKILSKKNFEEIRKTGTTHQVKENDVYFPKDRINTVHYGMGWFNYEYGKNAKKTKVFSHQGAWSGYRSTILYVPEYEIGLVILSNYGSVEVSLLPECIRSQFLDMLLNINDCDWCNRLFKRKKTLNEDNERWIEEEKYNNPRPHAPLVIYTGKFHNDLYGTIEIQKKDNILNLIVKGKSTSLTHLNGDKFLFKPSQLSEAFSDPIIGLIEFGLDKQKRRILYCSIMNEGPNPLFIAQ